MMGKILLKKHILFIVNGYGVIIRKVDYYGVNE